MTQAISQGVAESVATRDEIIRCEVGSTLHGLGVGSDDRDEMGVCLEAPEYVIGLRHFEQWTSRTQPQGARSGPGDLDLVVYGARKFCSLALKGNPSVLVLFYAPEDKCVTLTDAGRILRESEDLFASKRAGSAFLGYMTQQRQRLQGERGQMNVKRPELVEAHGYDTKYAGHILRLGYQGIEYLSTGRLELPMEQEARERILAVRRGEVPYNDVLTLAGELERALKEAIDASFLPEVPDHSRVNDLLEDLYLQSWGVR